MNKKFKLNCLTKVQKIKVLKYPFKKNTIQNKKKQFLGMEWNIISILNNILIILIFFIYKI